MSKFEPAAKSLIADLATLGLETNGAKQFVQQTLEELDRDAKESAREEVVELIREKADLSDEVLETIIQLIQE